MILVAHADADSNAALDWAAAEAARRDDELVILNVVALPGNLAEFAFDVPEEMEQAARADLAEAETRAREAGATNVRTVVGYRDAAGAIVEMSREADLVVVGNRGHGEVESALLGSVAYAVTSHSECPVVVIRGGSDRSLQDKHPVVVGIDGSRAGVRAARFAADLAHRAGSELVVVAVWEVPTIGGVSREFAARIGIEGLDSSKEDRAREWVDLATATLPKEYPGLEVTGVTVEGSPVVVLREQSQSRGAALLVVGSRGRGGFRGLLLGSVSHKLIHDAGCPIAVVR